MSTKKETTERAMVDEQPAENTAAAQPEPAPEAEPEAPKAGARYYYAERNPAGAYLPGVPLGDLDEDQFAALPFWVQRSVDASGFWLRTKPRKPAEGTEE